MLHCPHAPACPGCSQLHRPYDEQLLWKQQHLLNTFAPFPELAALPVAPVVPASPTVAYRTRAKWQVGSEGQIGLFRRNSHDVVDLPTCQIVAPSLLRVSQSLRDALAAPGWLRDHLRAVDLREVRSTRHSGVLVTLVVPSCEPVPLAQAREASAFLIAFPEVLGVALNLVEADSPQVLGLRTLPLHGLVEVEDTVGVSTILTTFGAFAQAHRGQAAALQQVIASAALGPTLELYGGSGSLGLAIAHRGFSVDSVESFAPASKAASEAAKAARVPFHAWVGDAAKFVRKWAQQQRPYDLVVVNPPRRGLMPEVREAIVRLAPRCVAYMSCEPRTLARDLAHFSRLGYAAMEAAPYDMIPWTDEIETLVFLKRQVATAPRLLWEIEDGAFFEKASHESLKQLCDRVQTLRGWEHAAPVVEMSPQLSGPCLLLREPSGVGVWRQALSGSRWIWKGWVRGIPHRSGMLGKGIRYRRGQVHGGHALIEIQSGFDLTEFFRARLASLGHPILGDSEYGSKESNRYFFEKFGLDRVFLHASSITLTPPGSLENKTLDSPWPADLLLPDGPNPG